MPGHVTHGAAPRRVFREKRTFSKCDAFSLRDRRGEGDFKELFFTFLILIVEAQVASAALGLSCAHGRQVPLPSTDQIKARELLTSADQTQALNSGFVSQHRYIRLPPPTNTPTSRPRAPGPAMPSGLRHIMALTGNAMSWAHEGGQVGTPTASCLGSVGCRPPSTLVGKL